MQRSLTLRLAALLSAGVLVVHELRYRLAFGADAGAALDARGHGYVPALSVAVCLLLAVALGQLLRRLAAGERERPVSRAKLGVLIAASLLGIYTGQELLEGVLSPGHPAGLAGVFGDGGWIAVPLAICFGAIGARLLAVACAAALAVSGPSPSLRLITPVVVLWRPVREPGRALASLARHLAGRAPPLRWS